MLAALSPELLRCDSSEGNGERGKILLYTRGSEYKNNMPRSVKNLVESYNPEAQLAGACAPPASWHTDDRVFELEQRTVFARAWQIAGRAGQLREPGQFVTCEISGEPILLVRGNDGVLRGFFNICRHKGAALVTEAEGKTESLRCPYHAWNYSLHGELKSALDFAGVRNFDPANYGLVTVETAAWEKWLFVRLDTEGASLQDFFGSELIGRIAAQRLDNLHWFQRRRYTVDCNWKVFVDNYLDGGYHVPHVHRGLNSVLKYNEYTIEIGARFCLQSSPMVTDHADAQTVAVRRGAQALYFWIYPNFMINCYQNMMDTNFIRPIDVNRTEVIFDFYFADISEQARDPNLASIEVSERIQQEDLAICHSVQRGLASRAYSPGRLSVRREAGEHLFHRLLYHDLKSGID